MKSFFAIIFCLINLTQIYGTILSSFESELTSIVDPVVGEIGDVWRQYVIGLSSIQTIVSTSVIYAILNGTTGGITGWFKLSNALSSTQVTRFILNTTNIGDLSELTLVNSLSNDLQIKYIELDTKGALLFLNGLDFNYNGTSNQGYAYVNFQLPSVGQLTNIINGLSSNVALLNTITSQLTTVTNIVQSFLEILNPILGLLGGL